MGEQRRIAVRDGIEYDNGHCHAGFAECYAFFNHSYCEICGSERLHGLAGLYGAYAVSVGLDHCHDARAGRNDAAVVIIVVGHGIEVDFERGLVSGAFERSRHFIEEFVVLAEEQNLHVV